MLKCSLVQAFKDYEILLIVTIEKSTKRCFVSAYVSVCAMPR